jgi:hypothetical protein
MMVADTIGHARGCAGRCQHICSESLLDFSRTATRRRAGWPRSPGRTASAGAPSSGHTMTQLRHGRQTIYTRQNNVAAQARRVIVN